MIKIKHKGDFHKTENFFKRVSTIEIRRILEMYGKQGVAALSAATPVDSGITSSSWGYEVKVSKGTSSISWTNSKMAGSTPLVILLQYGHGTRNGGYVQGRDFINPAIRPIFDQIANDAWREVTKL